MKGGVFSKDSIAFIAQRPFDEVAYERAQDARLDRLRYRYERRYGRPLPTRADFTRAYDRYRETHLISEFAAEYGVIVRDE